MENNKISIMLCLPMTGVDNDVLNDNIEKYKKILIEKYNDKEIDFLVNVGPDDDSIGKTFRKPHLYFMARGISDLMPYADYMAFAPDWETSRGCRIEKYMADTYEIPTIMIGDFI